MANTLLISFEIEWGDDEAAYNSIWEALNKAVVQNRLPSQWWRETTSFYIVQTSENSAQFAKRVWDAAKMRKSKDRLVVINMNGQGGAAVGNVQDNTIFSLLPVVKKLG